ncbi:hypothetical protein ACVWU4_001008 [Campylobacter coli]
MEDINTHEEASSSSKRKQVEQLILTYIKKIVSGDDNYNLYVNLFKNMTDAEFHQFMLDLRDDKTRLQIIVPTGDEKNKVSVNNNFKIAKELGYNFFQRLVFPPTDDEVGFTTPVKHIIYKLPIRSVVQSLTKKISLPESNVRRDAMTGQVTGEDKAAKLTLPEIQVLIGLGLDKTIEELLKHRGGDLGAENALIRSLVTFGDVSQSQIAEFSTGVKSTETLKTLLLGMHINSTL